MPQESYSNRKSVSFKSLKVGVLAGGNSSERKISLRSGRAVYQALKRAGFLPSFLDTKNSKKFRQSLKKIQVAFIALHGRGGEDGTMQRFLEKARVPYIGSGPISSWRAFDKESSKKIFIKHKIPTPPFVIVSQKNWRQTLSRFPTPFFVKPLREGSSIGAFAVEDFEKMAVKIGQAVKRFQGLLVEKKIEGREFTVGVLGEQALPVIELRPKGEFYDYHSKYTKGMTDYLVPAPISAALSKKLQRIGLKTHRVLGLRDFSRVDIMVDRKGKPYVLEANSIPGFTELSLLPKAAKARGISFEALCEMLVGRAYQRSKIY